MIKVKVDEINEELARFNSAINQFQPYTDGFIKNTANKLEGFNGDFTDRIQKVLGNMTDTCAPKLLQKAQSLYDATKNTVDSFVETDKAIKDKINEQK